MTFNSSSSTSTSHPSTALLAQEFASHLDHQPSTSSIDPSSTVSNHSILNLGNRLPPHWSLRSHPQPSTSPNPMLDFDHFLLTLATTIDDLNPPLPLPVSVPSVEPSSITPSWSPPRLSPISWRSPPSDTDPNPNSPHHRHIRTLSDSTTSLDRDTPLDINVSVNVHVSVSTSSAQSSPNPSARSSQLLPTPVSSICIPHSIPVTITYQLPLCLLLFRPLSNFNI